MSYRTLRWIVFSTFVLVLFGVIWLFRWAQHATGDTVWFPLVCFCLVLLLILLFDRGRAARKQFPDY